MDMRMNISRDERIWLNPPKFWAATKHMTPDDVDRLMNELIQLAEKHDIEALKRYDFILVAGRTVPDFFRQTH